MIMIYSHITSTRLQYISSLILKELMGVEFVITLDSEEFIKYTGAKINYSNANIQDSKFTIRNTGLLFETELMPQQIECFESNGKKAFFKTSDSDFPFDIFAASFYLVSRYEEYLPHDKDSYGRFAHENSLAYKECFLHIPLINFWVKDLSDSLKKKFPELIMLPPPYSFQPTYDIDIAFSYKYKGFLRNAGGFIRSPSLERILVLSGLKKDPFDSYKWLNNLHQQHNVNPVYFFLVSEKNGKFDKNILPSKDAMWNLIRSHAKKYTIGLHPSWQSGNDDFLLKKEKAVLEAMAECSITKSRQHYVRFNLPDGYTSLTEAGIMDDYSMGYGSINGFRASVASAFYWYNLAKEEQTDLRIHPFCFMDANAYYEQEQTTQQTFDEMNNYLSVCKEINGTLITIWHNNFLGTAEPFNGWKEMYERFIVQAQQ